MVEVWALWIPVFATGVGAVIGFGANLATTLVAARMQERREQRAVANENLDAALRSLKDIGRQLQREVVYPGWPSLRMLYPIHEFAYEVARRVPDAAATRQWLEAADRVREANSNTLRVLGWRLFKVGADERKRLATLVAESELAMATACERLRP